MVFGVNVNNRGNWVRLECEELKKDKKPKKNEPQTVHLYNIQEKSSGTYADNAYLNKPDDDNIVPHSDKKITSNQANVTKHEDKNINYQSMI